ncbi:MAG: bifunctional glutamate N-acetyltransferase/amino-acid acetyltransferase ArgJ [Chloroflexota bacterium]
MDASVAFVPSGSVTSPRGFQAGATYAGLKKKADGTLDLGILFAEVPCAVAGRFTSNKIKAAPVLVCQQRLKRGKARAVVVNSGCANACIGAAGLADATRMAELAAGHIGVSPQDVLVASTGVIGQRLPVELIEMGMSQIALSPEGGPALARAMMTTDTVPKEVAVSVAQGEFVIGGVAKGVGMMHPSLATLLCFLTTDAAVTADFLKTALAQAVDVSFNMVSVDGCSSTNDTVLLMASGLAGNEPISKDSRRAETFQKALDQACIYLARAVARDGEGATKLIEVTVNGALNLADARLAARTIVSSSLLKAAVYGNDPNWGRVMAALGQSGVAVEESKVDLYIGGTCMFRSGRPQPFDREEAAQMLATGEVVISLNLNRGGDSATAWGCDLSEKYVTINSHYTT